MSEEETKTFTSYTLELKDTSDLLDQFQLCLEAYLENPSHSGNAVTCAMLAWHTLEWHLWDICASKDLFLIERKNALDEHKCLWFIKDIAEGTKHGRDLDKKKRLVFSHRVQNGEFGPDFGEGFLIDDIFLTEEDGATYRMSEIVRETEHFLSSAIGSKCSDSPRS
ncbi:hypothetical protein [Parvularcula dongshanensis]|uniref:Uncharacterized protein n=1 Tax=Parvularcula dongshanensis TaxID=1173995 RepID=A0A840I4G9_9PROT|nr:hypothetical protein [Parvularcula dongshanensis]MBB4659163.1 hypothetical protein [Parvularcula dongshanensis]